MAVAKMTPQKLNRAIIEAFGNRTLALRIKDERGAYGVNVQLEDYYTGPFKEHRVVMLVTLDCEAISLAAAIDDALAEGALEFDDEPTDDVFDGDDGIPF